MQPYLRWDIQNPPSRPFLKIPWIARGYGAEINAVLDSAWDICYKQGLLYGFIAGLSVATLILVTFGRSRK